MATATPTPLPSEPPAVPLPPAAVAALSRLELAFAPVEVARAVTRYEVASARTVELSHLMDVRDLSGAEFDSLFDAQDVMRESRRTLAAAGMLHLIGGAS